MKNRSARTKTRVSNVKWMLKWKSTESHMRVGLVHPSLSIAGKSQRCQTIDSTHCY
jgi:hypothetical protein